MQWVAERFGSKTGLARYVLYRTLWFRFPKPSNEKLAYVQRLVFICKGNICRSPFAETVAAAAGMPSVSYGLSTQNGKPAHPKMIEAARKLGYELEAHNTRSIDRYDAREGDLLLAMEPRHIAALTVSRSPHAEVALLGQWLKPRRVYIHDPFSCSARYAERCATLIEGAVSVLVEEITRSKAELPRDSRAGR